MLNKIITFVYTLFHAKLPKKIAKQRKENIMTENEISYKIIGAAIEIHKSIGPGLLESAYENALAFDLKGNIYRIVNNL